MGLFSDENDFCRNDGLSVGLETGHALRAKGWGNCKIDDVYLLEA